MSGFVRWLRHSDLGVLLLLALARLAFHTATNGQYGFHRDELALLDDARYLAWGYVAYPPVTPFIARVALDLFGLSLVGARFFSALAQSLVMVVAGLMTRELGGGRKAQVAAALAVAIGPVSLIQGAMLQYVSFDLLWWVLAAYLVLRRLGSDDLRWWLGIGAVIGVGLMTKYTMAFLVAGIVGGVLLTPLRRDLRSPWLWGGVGLALLICLPNLLWQAQHQFVSLTFLSSIHARDVAIGRAQGFLVEQFFVAANATTIPFWLTGLWFYFRSKDTRDARYRAVGWMYAIPLVLLAVAQGRSYYLAPAYPMLIAAGMVVWERRLARLRGRRARLAEGGTWAALAVGAVLMVPVMTPIAPINSPLWRVSNALHDNFAEQVGWPELVATVAQIYAALPASEQTRTGILAGNYGEAGALNLYGPAYGLPTAISGVNSYWRRGYGDLAPESLIVVGFAQARAEQLFARCEMAGRVTNPYGVENEETRDHPVIFVCREPRLAWPSLWETLRSFG